MSNMKRIFVALVFAGMAAGDRVRRSRSRRKTTAVNP